MRVGACLHNNKQDKIHLMFKKKFLEVFQCDVEIHPAAVHKTCLKNQKNINFHVIVRKFISFFHFRDLEFQIYT